jgi:hypothetical protein
VKPETISQYGENENYVCDKCHDGTTTSSSYRVTNGGIKIKSTDSTETDYRDFVSLPSKKHSTSSTETNVVNAIRYFEEKQQTQTPKTSELDGYLLSHTNENEYYHHHHNGKI